jgi:hypothetical protein
MIVPISRIVIVLLGLAVFLLAAWGMIDRKRLMGFVKGIMDRPQGMVIAVGARIVMGLALIMAAPASKFPKGFQFLGVLALAAAIVLPFIGRRRLSALIGWFDHFGPILTRTWLILGLIFSGFLVYGIF